MYNISCILILQKILEQFVLMSRLLLLLLTLLIVLNASIGNGFKNFHFVNNHRISPLKCPCQDASLCQPIPRAKGHTKLAYSTNPSNWKYYELSKITELALTYDVSKMDPQLICAAHKNNVQLHLMITLSNETFMDGIKTGEWIEDQIDLLKENYLDGIDIDYEVPRQVKWIPHIVNLVGNLSERMKLSSPNYQLTYCIFGDPSNNPEVFNSIIIPTVVDYFMLMAYDDGFSIEKDECYATANQSPELTIIGNSNTILIFGYSLQSTCQYATYARIFSQKVLTILLINPINKMRYHPVNKSYT